MEGQCVNQPTCPSCGALTTDGLLCTRETNALMRNLAELPSLLRELQTTLTRQSQSGSGNGGKGAERPLPFDNNASEVGDVVKNTLSTWVRELDLGDTDGLADNPRALAHWLLLRIERIRGHAACTEIADEIGHCVKLISRAIDNRAEQVYLGPCQNIVEGKPCATQLYAPAHAEAYDCPNEACKVPVNVAARRAELLALVEDSVATINVCSQVLARFGHEVKASTIQNWVRSREDRAGKVWPPKLWSKGKDEQGRETYRLGDVTVLAMEMLDKKAERRRKAS